MKYPAIPAPSSRTSSPKSRLEPVHYRSLKPGSLTRLLGISCYSTDELQQSPGSDPIRRQLTPDKQVRFHNLLMLAKESPFTGERANALAGAERLAKRHGMTLEEAAMRQAQPAAVQGARTEQVREKAAFVHMTDYQIHVEKQQRDSARREAETRGLGAKERKAAARTSSMRQVRRSTARMDPDKHAWNLVRETRLPYHEIARITGVNIYEVLLMKIQLLRAA